MKKVTKVITNWEIYEDGRLRINFEREVNSKFTEIEVVMHGKSIQTNITTSELGQLREACDDMLKVIAKEHEEEERRGERETK